MFAGGYKRPNTMSTIGAMLQDVSAGLDRREGGYVDRLIAKGKAEQDDANYRELIGSMEDMDPLEQMLAIQDPKGYMNAKVGDAWKQRDLKAAAEREDARDASKRRADREDMDTEHGYRLDEEEAKAGRPRVDNTGQAIVLTDPKAGTSKVLYRDDPTQSKLRKTYRAMTPEEVKARGWPAGSTGQIDSDGRAYQDKMTKPQSQYSQTEIRSFRDRADGMMTLGNALNQYINVLEDVGGPRAADTPWDQEAVGKLKSAHGLITSAIKDADALGALDQGVQNLVNSIVQNPVDWSNIGKSTESIKSQAKQVWDSIDYRLNRIPEQYRGGATGNVEMAWRVPDDVKKARAYLQNYDRLPAMAKRPEYKAYAEKIISDFGNRAQAPPTVDEEPADSDYENAMNSFDVDLETPPQGVDPQDWEYLSPEERMDFIRGN